ncbi:MAG TPA: N-acetylmuramoyl-L-alanine amidase [Pseudonocardia sp.]|jgi:hypothetical protein
MGERGRSSSGRGPELSRRGLMALLGGLAVSTPVLVGDRAGGMRLVADAVPTPGTAPTPDTDPAVGAAGRPRITGCDAWHARPPSAPVTVLNKRPIKILVHHTATDNLNNVAQPDLEGLARGIQDFHMNTNGWLDSGHHFLVNRGGLVAEGRHQSLDTLVRGTRFVEGAHCPDQNDVSIGIENQGTYTQVAPPAAQLVTLRALLAYACRQYGIDPSQIYGHRDFRDTQCPGDKLYAMLPALRQQVAQLLGRPANKRVSTPPTWPLLESEDTGPHVLAAQHLLRNAGLTTVPADGRFGSTTTDGVILFQRRHGLEQSGLIGGGSWPLLAVPVSPGDRGEAGQAVRALLNGSDAESVGMPDTVTAATWQELLGTR